MSCDLSVAWRPLQLVGVAFCSADAEGGGFSKRLRFSVETAPKFPKSFPDLSSAKGCKIGRVPAIYTTKFKIVVACSGITRTMNSFRQEFSGNKGNMFSFKNTSEFAPQRKVHKNTYSKDPGIQLCLAVRNLTSPPCQSHLNKPPRKWDG